MLTGKIRKRTVILTDFRYLCLRNKMAACLHYIEPEVIV